MQKRSAEWLRGAVHVAKDREEPVAVAYYTQLLAEAEASEASVSDGDASSMADELKSLGDRWNKWVGPAGDESRYKRMAACAYAGVEALRREASVPTAAEVIAAAEDVIQRTYNVNKDLAINKEFLHVGSTLGNDYRSVIAAITKYKEAQR